MYFKASFGDNSLTLLTAAKLCFSIFVIILFEKPYRTSLLCQNQRQLEVNVCGTTVVVIPVSYSCIRLYFYISKISPVFGQELNAHREQTTMAQTSIVAICDENEHPDRFQPLLGK